MADLSGIGDIISGSIGGLLGIHNVFAQEEQKRYDRQLQQQLFEREDNAVQRRVADLKKAGLNPILASGQGASAGPVASAGSNRQVNPSILQTMMLSNLENMKLQNKQLKTSITAQQGSDDYLMGRFLQDALSGKDIAKILGVKAGAKAGATLNDLFQSWLTSKFGVKAPAVKFTKPSMYTKF